MTSKRAIIGSFAFLDASQLLSEFEGNFVFKFGRFGIIIVEEKVVDGLVSELFVQLSSCKITNVTTEAMSWIRYFKFTEKKFWFVYFVVGNISTVTFTSIAFSAIAVSVATSAVTSAAASLKIGKKLHPEIERFQKI